MAVTSLPVSSNKEASKFYGASLKVITMHINITGAKKSCPEQGGCKIFS
jgi:hypothetical protein